MERTFKNILWGLATGIAIATALTTPLLPALWNEATSQLRGLYVDLYSQGLGHIIASLVVIGCTAVLLSPILFFIWVLLRKSK